MYVTWKMYMPRLPDLTHWGRVTHICVGNLIIIGSDNGLSPDRRQATLSESVLEYTLQWHFNRNSYIFIKKMHFKMSSGKWPLFYLQTRVLLSGSSTLLSSSWLAFEHGARRFESLRYNTLICVERKSSIAVCVMNISIFDFSWYWCHACFKLCRRAHLSPFSVDVYIPRRKFAKHITPWRRTKLSICTFKPYSLRFYQCLSIISASQKQSCLRTHSSLCCSKERFCLSSSLRRRISSKRVGIASPSWGIVTCHQVIFRTKGQ